MRTSRFLAIALAAATTLTALPEVTFAATDNNTWSYSYDQATKTLTISGSGDMEDYSFSNYNENPLYSYKNMTENIVVDGVSSIGDWAFAYFTKAKTVTISDSVTEIGKDAFHNDTIVSIDIPDSVTKIDNDAFWYCQSLTDVEIPDSVTYIGEYAFYNCTSLKDVEIPGSVKEIRMWSFWAAGTNSISIGEGTTTIDADAFFYSNRLMLPSTIASIHKDTFGGAGDRQQVIFGRNTYVEKYARTYGYYYFDLNKDSDIADCNITGIPEEARFTNSAITLNTIKLSYVFDETGVLNLTEGTDYEVSYSDNDKVGNATVTITGKGIFSGSVSKTFEIYDYITNYDCSIPSDTYYYTGSAIEPEVTVEGLTKDVDYTVEYSDNTDEGVAIVTIAGKGFYKGTANLFFYIYKKSIYDYTFSIPESDYYYTGEAIEPEVICDNEDVEFTVEYDNNVEEGIATATITGTNCYKGTVVLYFSIIKKSIYDYTFSIPESDYYYTGEAIEPEVTVEGLTKDVDYTVEYDNNVEEGIATATITGINTYKDSETLYFYIYKRDINEFTATIENNEFEYTGEAIEPEVTVEGLTKDVDYTVEYDNNTEAGTAFITINGIGKYTGTIGLTFEITMPENEDATPVDATEEPEDVVTPTEETTPVEDNTEVVTPNETPVEVPMLTIETPTDVTEDPVDTEDENTEEADESEDDEIIVIGNNIYTIISDTEVEFSGIQNNKAKVTIPASINYNGKKYTVTSIGEGALLGKNKVKTVVIKSTKVLSVGSKAFKGIKKTATIKVATKKLVTAYKKALTSTTGFKSTMTIKK